jgi:CDP-diacylglycerol--serine O-phosphatidyltransferase
MAFKFSDYTFKNNAVKYILLVISVISIIWLKWLAVPVIFVLYLVFSMFSKEPPPMVSDIHRQTLDVTV